jgi:hypothetical protein
MIRAVKVIFCENEHGSGDVTFPDWQHIEPLDFQRAATGANLR